MGVSAARDLLVTHFESADAAEPIVAVEQRMKDQRVGAIFVRRDGSSMGSVVTMRMLVDLHGDDVDLAGISAGDVAREVTPVAAGDSLEAALEALRTQRVARLPVVDGGRELGIITRGDILAYLEVAERLGPKITDLVVDVSPNDEMFAGSLAAYLATGAAGVEGVKRAQAAAGKETIGSILDFGCGHGRVLRMLKAEFPHASLAACDIDTDGVRFCAQAFGARPFPSHRDPALIELEGEFDLVWCGSLLTHLDAASWNPFLELFESVLRPGGLLVFTVLGPAAEPNLRAGRLYGAPPDEGSLRTILAGYESVGYGYSDYEGRSGYGLSLCTPDWVRRAIAARDRLRLLHHEEGAVTGIQDIVACEALTRP